MIFELIDSKKKCDSCFVDGEIIKFSSLESGSHTWDYSPMMGDKKYELACLYAGTKNIEDACSHSMRERYLISKSKLRSYLKSFVTAQVSLDEYCFYDLVPISFIKEFFSIRNELIQEIFLTKERPKNYDFLYDLNRMLINLSDKKVKFSPQHLKEVASVSSLIQLGKSLGKTEKATKYNLFGAITGRLTTEPDSFPILTLSKAMRPAIESTNSFLLELDFNAFEPRVMLALNGKKQPEIDVHEWNRINIFCEEIPRDEAKKKFLAWMYDERGTHKLTASQEKISCSVYDKNSIKNKYYDGNIVKNFFQREIMADAEHSLNYIVQSTASDVFLRQAILVDKLLHNKKSFVKFLIHDSIVVDMDVTEKDMAKEICETFSNTCFGKFLITRKVGKGFGDMRTL